MTQDEKRIFEEALEEEKRWAAATEKRTTATLQRATQKIRDNLWCIQQGLQSNIAERKTSLTAMNNLLNWTNGIIENLKEAGLWPEEEFWQP